MRSPRLIFIAIAMLLCGCLELPEFASGSIVTGPRVLAVVAEPPEIRPGETLDLSILIAGVEDPTETEITWRACGSFDGFGGGGGQYGEDQPDEGCGGGLAFDLGAGPTAQLPGVLTTDLFDNLDVIAMTIGTDLPEDIVDQIRSSVGIAFLIEATVRAEGKMIRATKRVLLSENETPHTNPPPPQLAFGPEQMIITEPSDPLRCVRDDGEPVTAAPSTDIELAPFAGALIEGEEGAPDEEAWLETYNILNARGELRERKERAFYAWYATAGELDSGSTESPLRNNIWRTPSEQGDYPLWLIVRDGHGGTSACELTVTVD